MTESEGRTTSEQVAHQVRRGRRSDLGRAAARIGLGSRAVVYIALAVLVLQLALGDRPDDTDQAGALRELGSQPVGVALLWLLVGGVVCYVLWRLAEVIGGPAGKDDSKRERVLSAIEGLFYVPIAVMAATIAAGDPAGAQQGDAYRSFSATVMQDWPAGRLLVGAVGLVVMLIGGYLGSQGPRRSFCGDLDFDGHRRTERTVVGLGVIGSTARGAVFALAGVLVVAAAVTADPDKAGGVDAALLSVAEQPYGPVVLCLVALGLACFAAFTVGEALWRKV